MHSACVTLLISPNKVDFTVIFNIYRRETWVRKSNYLNQLVNQLSLPGRITKKVKHLVNGIKPKNTHG